MCELTSPISAEAAFWLAFALVWCLLAGWAIGRYG